MSTFFARIFTERIHRVSARERREVEQGVHGFDTDRTANYVCECQPINAVFDCTFVNSFESLFGNALAFSRIEYLIAKLKSRVAVG